MPREKIEFPKNVEVEVALAFASGKECESPISGTQFLYSTTDERVFYATPTLNQKIQALEPHRGEAIRICLRNNRETGGKNIWDVSRVGDQGGEAPVAVGQAANTSTRQANSSSNGHQNGNGNGNGNSNGHKPTPTPAATSLMTGQSQGMLDQFIGVYEILVAVERYSELKGRPVVFTSEDFRSTAISCYIQRSREGGR